jgi:hypothetical protein
MGPVNTTECQQTVVPARAGIQKERQTHKNHVSEQYGEQKNSDVWNTSSSMLPLAKPVRRTVDNYSERSTLSHQIEPMQRIVVTNKGQVRFENVVNEQRRQVDQNHNKPGHRVKHVNGTMRVLKTRATDSMIIDDNQSIRSKSSSFLGDPDMLDVGEEEQNRMWNNAQGTWDEADTPQWPGEQRRDSTSSFSDRDGKHMSEQRQEVRNCFEIFIKICQMNLV